jgi:hypothetical protein
MKKLILTSTLAVAALGFASLGPAQAQRVYHGSAYDTPAAIPGEVVGGAVTTGGDVVGGVFTAGNDIVGGILGPFVGPMGGPVRAQPVAYGSFGVQPGCRPARALVDGNWRRAVICP